MSGLKTTTIRRVWVELIPDEDPDPSYLEQDGFEDRLAKYHAGDFSYFGVRANAEVLIHDFGSKAGILQTLSSPGLWGIESDSGADYLNEVGRDELDILGDILRAFHVRVSDNDLRTTAEYPV